MKIIETFFIFAIVISEMFQIFVINKHGKIIKMETTTLTLTQQEKEMLMTALRREMAHWSDLGLKQEAGSEGRQKCDLKEDQALDMLMKLKS